MGLSSQCLSEVEPGSKPIGTVSHLINVRAFIYLSSSSTYFAIASRNGHVPGQRAGQLNAVFWLSTGLQVSKGVIPRKSCLAGVADVRKSLGRLKNPRFIENMAADMAKTQSEVVWDKSGQNLIVNSLKLLGRGSRLGRLCVWQSAHFGHPGKVKFHFGRNPGSRFTKIIRRTLNLSVGSG